MAMGAPSVCAVVVSQWVRDESIVWVSLWEIGTKELSPPMVLCHGSTFCTVRKVLYKDPDLGMDRDTAAAHEVDTSFLSAGTGRHNSPDMQRPLPWLCPNGIF